MSDINARLFNIISDIFQLNVSKIDEKLSPENFPKWDSLKHMILLMAIEEEFEFRFTDDEMAKCLSVSSILEVLKTK
tara:strand:- start:206 stop:436 length:231 start_codon:yes stop_codon:yes gene_type:complete